LGYTSGSTTGDGEIGGESSLGASGVALAAGTMLDCVLDCEDSPKLCRAGSSGVGREFDAIDRSALDEPETMLSMDIILVLE
jgi:hypothetical protein